MAPTPEQFEEKQCKPTVGDIICSPHKFIFERGYPLYHKVLKAKNKKIKGETKLVLTVKTTTPLKKVVKDKHDIIYPDDVY